MIVSVILKSANLNFSECLQNTFSVLIVMKIFLPNKICFIAALYREKFKDEIKMPTINFSLNE